LSVALRILPGNQISTLQTTPKIFSQSVALEDFTGHRGTGRPRPGVSLSALKSV
jgi:hypothetical protein